MGKFIDLTGKKFGRLTVIKRDEDYVSPKGVHSIQWLCKCDCGKEKIVDGSSLRSQYTKSCGCYNREVIIERNKKRKGIHKRYNTWELFMTTNKAVGTDSKGNKFTIDIEDWVKCKDYCWLINDYGYVTTGIDGKFIQLHRFIMNPPKGMLIDHINGDPTDNRKSNLRIVTQQQNSMNHTMSNRNTSGHTGVYWEKGWNKWTASISYKKEYIYLGHFNNLEDAIKARQEAEKKYFGEYRRKEE